MRGSLSVWIASDNTSRRAASTRLVRPLGTALRYPPMVRRILFASLALAPATIAIHYLAHPGGFVDFTLAALALIPLAWIIGEATEQAAHHTGPGIGGFLNATFGNAPELIIALFAVADGLFEVVRGSLTGSVIGNLLLVLGFSLLFGGRGALDRASALISLGLVFLATLMFLVPAAPAFGADDPERRLYAQLSIAPAIVLLVAYVVTTYLSLRRHRQLHAAGKSVETTWSLRLAIG